MYIGSLTTPVDALLNQQPEGYDSSLRPGGQGVMFTL